MYFERETYYNFPLQIDIWVQWYKHVKVADLSI